MNAKLTIFTIGYSTLAINKFLEILKSHEIKQLVDVRTIARSRARPEFNEQELKIFLEKNSIRYVHMTELGGLRKPVNGSINTAWQNASFRGFADYMQTDRFWNAIFELIKIASEQKTVLMCAEGNPYRCHRSLIADALVANGVAVYHISSVKSAKEHKITTFSQIKDGRVTYPKND
ncbi:MAG: DUF488 domain-containing protein [Thermoplasmata archaeon]